MAGIAYAEGGEALSPGVRCIVAVDEANWPTGLWWGEVTAANVCADGAGKWVGVVAKIIGKFVLDATWQPVVVPSEEAGREPRTNYRVYPDTEMTRALLWRLEIERRATETVRRKADQWKEIHLETVEHLARRGLVREGT